MEKLNDYQVKSGETAKPNIANNLPYLALGLVGEAGEIAEKVKKAIRDTDNQIDTRELAKEMGDVLWYLAQLATFCKIDLSEVADMNIEKLQSRKARGKIEGSGDNR